MMASNLANPDFDDDCVQREINAIESEFKMNSYDDTVRMIQILQDQTVDKNHIFNRFAWGNRESLGQKKDLTEEDLTDPKEVERIH